jgi:hypothetical protein
VILSKASKAGDKIVELDVRHLPRGRYFIHIQNDREIKREMIVLE